MTAHASAFERVKIAVALRKKSRLGARIGARTPEKETAEFEVTLVFIYSPDRNICGEPNATEFRSFAKTL